LLFDFARRALDIYCFGESHFDLLFVPIFGRAYLEKLVVNFMTQSVYGRARICCLNRLDLVTIDWVWFLKSLLRCLLQILVLGFL